MEYWIECISEALDDSGIKATPEQIKNIAEWVDGSHENYDMATGLDIVESNYISPAQRELDKLKEEIEKRRIWECETKPCGACHGYGTIIDGWGRRVECDVCRGKGRC